MLFKKSGRGCSSLVKNSSRGCDVLGSILSTAERERGMCVCVYGCHSQYRETRISVRNRHALKIIFEDDFRNNKGSTLRSKAIACLDSDTFSLVWP